MYLRRIRLAECLESCKSWRRMLIFVTTGVGINFSPFDSNLISASNKTVLERFLINFSSPSFKEEICIKDFFLRPLRFFVLVCFFVYALPLFSFSHSALVWEHSENRPNYFSTSLLVTVSCRFDILDLRLLSCCSNLASRVDRFAMFAVGDLFLDLFDKSFSFRLAIRRTFQCFITLKLNILLFKAAVVKLGKGRNKTLLGFLLNRLNVFFKLFVWRDVCPHAVTEWLGTRLPVQKSFLFSYGFLRFSDFGLRWDLMG